MTRYFLVIIGNIGSMRQYLEGGSNIFHFGCDGIGPIIVAVLLVNLQCVFYGGWYIDSKLVVSLEVSGYVLPYEGYDTVKFLQHMCHPPVEGWLMVNSNQFCVLRSF